MANDYFRTMQKYPQRQKLSKYSTKTPHKLPSHHLIIRMCSFHYETVILSLFERENMEERSSPITYGSQMRYYENLFNEMLSQRTDLIRYNHWLF